MRALPPGPRSGFDLARRYFANRAVFLQSLSQEYGDIVFFRLGFFRVYLLTDPDDVRQVLVDRASRKTGITRLLLMPLLGNGLLVSEGEFYKKQRRLVQPAFHQRRMEGYADIVTACAANWRPQAGILDLDREMMALALDIAGRTLFGSQVGEEAEKIATWLSTFYAAVDRIVLLGPLAFILPHPGTLRLFFDMIRLHRLVGRLIDQRKRQEPRPDFLQMLIDAEEDGGRMSRTQVRSEALTLLLAGHETTAVALTWAGYLLSQNPECEARLVAELQGLEGRPPRWEDLERLVYTRHVVTETLRLYPPAYLLDRHPGDELTVRGYAIPPGSYLFLSPYVTHRDPRFFPEPERFRPERWEETPRPPAYFPFGMGPRACIGQSFAWMETVLALASIYQRYHFELHPDTVVDVDPKITLRPRHGMRMVVRTRD